MAKRILIIAGVGLIALAIVVVAISFRRDTLQPTLPSWLVQVKPTHTSRLEGLSLSGFIVEEARRLKVSLPELERMLDAGMNKEQGWRKTTSTSKVLSWFVRTNTDELRISAVKLSDGVAVYNFWQHTSTPAERMKRKVRRLFGAKD